jgi:microsomal epoxide hydrolase
MSRRPVLVVLLLIMATGSSVAQTSRRSFQTSDGVTLSFIESGRAFSEKSPSIVLIPGWSMPAAIWRGQIDYLGRRFHTLALDPRGQGESEVAVGGYTAERRASDIKEFLETFSKVLLVGWSLGAIESLQYVHMFGSARLTGMALVDSSVGEEPAPRSGGNFQQQLRENRDKALTEFARAIFVTKRRSEEIAELVRAAKRMPLEDSLALLDYPFERSHWRDIVRGFDKPLLYAVTPQYEAQAKNLKKHRPATQVEVFKKAGHALFVDEAARFNTLLEAFAKRSTR